MQCIILPDLVVLIKDEALKDHLGCDGVLLCHHTHTPQKTGPEHVQFLHSDWLTTILNVWMIFSYWFYKAKLLFYYLWSNYKQPYWLVKQIYFLPNAVYIELLLLFLYMSTSNLLVVLQNDSNNTKTSKITNIYDTKTKTTAPYLKCFH